MAELTDLKELAQTQRRQRDFEGAARTLQQTIERTWAELADLYGRLGGTQREQGDLVKAIAAYDRAFHIDERYPSGTSYSELNRLVTRILLRPACLSDPDVFLAEEGLEPVDVPKTLSQLQARLEEEVEGPRSGDFWAAGDLLLAAALNGDLVAATRALDRFKSSSPPEFAYGAYGQTVAALAELDTPRHEILRQIQDLLSPQAR